MKRTLFFATSFFCFLGLFVRAQGTICTVENGIAQQDVGATSNHKKDPTRTAIDIDVAPNENFLLDQVVVRLLSNPEIILADIVIYSDNNNIPGDEWDSMIDLVPSSNPIVGTTFSTSARSATFDFEPVVLTGGANGTKYWLTVAAVGQDPNEENISWELSGETFVGNYTMRLFEGSWEVITFNTAQYEAVYALRGTCEESKELEETEFQIELSPNPGMDLVKITSTKVLTSVSLIDVKGRIVQSITPVGNEVILNIEGLADEVLFIRVTAQDGKVITEKLLKN